MSRSNSLPRDVSINVVANLIAGAILYVAAVGAGYLKVNRALLVAAVLLITPVALGALYTAVGALRYVTANSGEGGKDRKALASAKVTIFLGAVSFVVPVLLISGIFLGRWAKGFGTYGYLIVIEVFLVGFTISGIVLIRALRGTTTVTVYAGCVGLVSLALFLVATTLGIVSK
jgi:hypothetical protein